MGEATLIDGDPLYEPHDTCTHRVCLDELQKEKNHQFALFVEELWRHELVDALQVKSAFDACLYPHGRPPAVLMPWWTRLTWWWRDQRQALGVWLCDHAGIGCCRDHGDW